jgi:CRP-like cAMP-binding protein
MAGREWPSDVDPRHNFLLGALPPPELDRLLPHLEPVEMDIRYQVYDVGKRIDAVHFPLTAVYSMVTLVDGETVIEVGTIGREGMVGLPVFLGATTSPNSVFVQIPGTGAVMPAAALQEVLRGDGALHRQLHRYTQATLVQLAQNVGCNRVHTTEERTARWLLTTSDRVRNDEFPLTQEFLAQMLGVRRATVSLAAGILQSAGLIRYRRGVITIVDRDGLQDVACDCYLIVRREFEALERYELDGPES